MFRLPIPVIALAIVSMGLCQDFEEATFAYVPPITTITSIDEDQGRTFYQQAMNIFHNASPAPRDISDILRLGGSKGSNSTGNGLDCYSSDTPSFYSLPKFGTGVDLIYSRYFANKEPDYAVRELVDQWSALNTRLQNFERFGSLGAEALLGIEGRCLSRWKSHHKTTEELLEAAKNVTRKSGSPGPEITATIIYLTESSGSLFYVSINAVVALGTVVFMIL